MGKIKTQNWSKVVMDRKAWRRIVEQVKICSAVPRKEEDKRNHWCFWNNSVF